MGGETLDHHLRPAHPQRQHRQTLRNRPRPLAASSAPSPSAAHRPTASSTRHPTSSTSAPISSTPAATCAPFPTPPPRPPHRHRRPLDRSRTAFTSSPWRTASTTSTSTTSLHHPLPGCAGHGRPLPLRLPWQRRLHRPGPLSWGTTAARTARTPTARRRAGHLERRHRAERRRLFRHQRPQQHLPRKTPSTPSPPNPTTSPAGTRSQNPALRGHRPRRHLRQSQSRHRSDLDHRL